MSTEIERRAQGVSRTPFDGMVGVEGAAGATFEAQAVNVSEDGMQLRTAYLPEAGQPLCLRFDIEPGRTVEVAGEVAWAKGSGKGGEFGIKFVDCDPETLDALRTLSGADGGEPTFSGAVGSRVRLHIDGLSSPMRARIRRTETDGLTVGSALGFLQVGRDVELEEADSGAKQAARIEDVAFELHPESRVPQLVVRLHYGTGPIGTASGDRDGREPTEKAEPEAVRAASSSSENLEPKMTDRVRGSLAKSMGHVGPALSGWATRVKSSVASLVQRSAPKQDAEALPRRVTSPAPSGGLRATGRRVVRDEAAHARAADAGPGETAGMSPKKKMLLGGALVCALALGTFGVKKAWSSRSQDAASAQAAAASPVVSAATPVPLPAVPSQPVASATTESDPAPPSADPVKPGKSGKGKHAKVAPFGNTGNIAHGNVLGIKLDGPIDKLQGAQLPNGFTVLIPHRKSTEAAGPLASRDSRIANIRVSNEAKGAELTVTFKDTVPRYQVRAKGETVEIVLATGDKSKKKKKN